MEIKVSFGEGKIVKAEFGGFLVQTDQSVKNGGAGTAPEPFMYFLSSIGTCAGIYVLGFCQKNNISTENISLVQRNEFAPDEGGKMRLSRVSIDIQVPPDFPEKYYDAIIRVADLCAVKKTIMSPPEFDIKTVVLS
ncbi:MAG: OsmC family protein [Nitrospirae bacterium]|nr:OsmC family protein [Nitrospirota bacterium]